MDPRSQYQLLEQAKAHQESGRVREAETIYRRVLAEHPTNGDALHLLGVLEAQRGNPQAALPLLQRSVAVLPNFAQAHRHLGWALGLLGRPQEALNSYARSLQLDPREAETRSDAAGILFSIGRVNDATEQLQIAAQMAPSNASVLGNLGYVLGRAGKVDEAVQILGRVTELHPRNAQVWMQLAECFWTAARYPQAVAPARRAAELEPNNPRAQLLLGNTLQTTGELEEAAQRYRRAMELERDYFDATNNLALTLLKMGDTREAARMYEQIRVRWPGARDAIANQSLALLTLGDFPAGFALYDARTTTAALEADRRAGKVWDGRDPRGKTIVLASEQGMGDTIHFVRYAPIIAERGATVIVTCPKELIGVASTVPGIAQIVPAGTPGPAYDLIASMGSLPRITGTTVETIPKQVPYMSADPQRVQRWQERLSGDRNVKVAIVWAGSPAHQNDRVRSASLADFAPLAGVEGVTFYSIQKGAAAAQASSPPAGMKLVPLGDELQDFTDTAALLACVDLLISVDTSVVHLAGALARPVWTLLARGPDWRWMLDREDSPWYPTMRLFRQQKFKQWKPVFERVAEELEKFAEAKRSAL